MCPKGCASQCPEYHRYLLASLYKLLGGVTLENSNTKNESEELIINIIF